MTTEGNPAYGVSGLHENHGETNYKDEYDYIQPSLTAPQETVYVGCSEILELSLMLPLTS